MRESWRVAWRHDVAPRLTTRGLEALAVALAAGDPRVRPGSYVSPWVGEHPDAEPEACCPIGYALWQGQRLERVDEVFSAVDELILGCRVVRAHDGTPYERLRWFASWVDTVPWPRVVELLLPEVRRSLAMRPAAAKEAVTC